MNYYDMHRYIHICSYINNFYLSLKKIKRKFRQKIFYPLLPKLFLIKYFGTIDDTELQYSAFQMQFNFKNTTF